MYGADHDVGEAAGMMRDLSLEGHHVSRNGMGANGHLPSRHPFMANAHVGGGSGMAAGGLSTSGMSTGNSRMFGGNGGQMMYNAAVGTGGAVASGSEAEEDRTRMADMEDSVRSMLPHDSSDSDDELTRPSEATAEEREEAEKVVRTAFKEAKEREKLREKVKKASPADLQALLNARLAKK